jgi:hypothetical protein
MKILGVVPPLMALPMVVPPSSSLFSVLKPIFDDNLKMLPSSLEHYDTM